MSPIIYFERLLSVIVNCRFSWSIWLLMCSAGVSADRKRHALVVCSGFCLAWYLFATWQHEAESQSLCLRPNTWELATPKYELSSDFILGFNFPDLCVFHVFSCTLAINSCGLSSAAADDVTHWFPHSFHCGLAMCLLCRSDFLSLFSYVH